MEVTRKPMPRPASTCNLAGNFTTADFDKTQLTVFWCESYRSSSARRMLCQPQFVTFRFWMRH